MDMCVRTFTVTAMTEEAASPEGYAASVKNMRATLDEFVAKLRSEGIACEPVMEEIGERTWKWGVLID